VKPEKESKMRRVVLLLFAIGAAAAVAWFVNQKRQSQPAGTDTPTGTDPNAKYDRAGYEDKSLGQAVNADMDLVDRLVAEEGGDLGAAQDRFAEESAGAPALRRQQNS